MRVLHLSDLHLRWFEWVTAHAAEFDLVAISGDIMDGFADVPLHKQAKICTDFLLGLPGRIAVVSGNHDSWCKPSTASVDTAAEGRWLRNLRGRANIVAVDGDLVEVAGVIVGCVGWLQSPDWATPPKIVIAHAPPSGCACAAPIDSSQDLGDAELWPLLRSGTPSGARVVLSGHIHEPRRHWCRWPLSRNTTIFNPGCLLDVSEPQHWIIDLDRGIAS